MKGDKKILTIAILLLLISVGFTTYAIYKSTTAAGGTVKLAAWHVEVGESDFTESPASTSFVLTLNDLDCTTHNGKNGTMAPGDTCTLKIPVSAAGSEVDVDFTATIGTVENAPAGMTVVLGNDATTETHLVQWTDSTAEGAMTYEFELEVSWPTADETTTNAADVSKQGQTVTIPVTLTAAQHAYN